MYGVAIIIDFLQSQSAWLLYYIQRRQKEVLSGGGEGANINNCMRSVSEIFRNTPI